MSERSELLTEAAEFFGWETVETVVKCVEESSPEQALSIFAGMKMKEHIECIEFIYFNN
jgi:hypothetical protein